MKIKVCGMRDAENIKAVAALEPDYMGFIFYKNSPRFVDELPADVLSKLPATINKVAVFVNEDPGTIRKIIEKYDFDFVQLHGNESPAFCKSLKDDAIVIKAFGIDKGFDFKQLEKYKNEMEIPFFLSGGLSPENIEKVKNITHPAFYGVDLNSKFEISPGLKDMEKLEKAFSII